MDGKTVYLSPEQLQEQNLPPLTLCGGPVAPYRVDSRPSELPLTPESPAIQQKKKPRALPSAKLGQILNDLTPEQRDQAARIAANLLALRAKKKATN